jgi:glycosyltransferase involved in cell wall biosynthesis
VVGSAERSAKNNRLVICLTKRRLNVCFLNARFFPIGGTAIRTLNFARAIENRVNSVSIITWQPTDSEEYHHQSSVLILDGITVNSMPLRHQFLRNNFRFLYLLTLMVEFFIFARTLVEKKMADVIHCANDTVWIGALLGKFTKIPVVADFHANPCFPGLEALPERTMSLQLLLSRAALKIADRLIAKYLTPTEELRAFLLSWGISPFKVIAIPNAICLNEKPLGRSRADVRAKLGIDEETIVIAFHGMLGESYNIGALKNLSSISRMVADHSELKIRFLIVGYYDKVPPVDDEFFIYTGYVENLQEYLRAADFALVPIFQAQGIRSRFLDYFKAALPVLTTPVGVTGMKFAQDCGGVIVRNDVKELAFSAMELARSPEKLKETASKSGNLVNWFLPEKIGDELLSQYDQVVYKKD